MRRLDMRSAESLDDGGDKGMQRGNMSRLSAAQESGPLGWRDGDSSRQGGGRTRKHLGF